MRTTHPLPIAQTMHTLRRRLAGWRRTGRAALLALALAGGAAVSPYLAGVSQAAAGFVIVYTSSDGHLILVCHYDDRTGALQYCDVLYRR